MRISKEQLQKIIAEEVQAHFKKSLMSESKSESHTIEATPAMLKRIINEEVTKLNEMGEKGSGDVLLDIRKDGVFVKHNGKEHPLSDGTDLGELLSAKYGVDIENIYYQYPGGSLNPPQPITGFQGVIIK